MNTLVAAPDRVLISTRAALPVDRAASAMSMPVGRSVLIYGCAFAVAGATPFLLLPILTRALSPQQFGEVTSFLILTTILSNAAGLSAHGFVSVRYFKTTTPEFRGLATSATLAVVAAHALAALALVALFPQLQRLLDLPLALSMLAVAAALVLSLNLIFLSIFQSAGQPLLYLRSRLVQAIIEFSLCVALITLFVADSGSRIYSYAAALAASAAVGLVMCWRRGHLGAGIDRTHLRSLAAFGLPMLPHIVAGSALVYVDRVVVSSLLGNESLGIYMVAMQIGMAMVVLIEPLNKALGPWLFDQLAKDDPALRRMIVRRTYMLYGVLAAIGIAVAGAASLFFDELIGARYGAARAIVPWMVAGFVLQGMYYSVVNYLFFAERTGRLSIMSSATAIVGCGVSYALTSSFGLAGAGISFAFNNGLLFVLVWFAASKAVPMPWWPWRA